MLLKTLTVHGEDASKSWMDIRTPETRPAVDWSICCVVSDSTFHQRVQTLFTCTRLRGTDG